MPNANPELLKNANKNAKKNPKIIILQFPASAGLGNS